ncbi:hypothetical protein F4678DRAFT_460478 [Xylaria arbuscula]|nr:hypothetical protein F4678DRAFT_460478 [Xylaria arbuscula]
MHDIASNADTTTSVQNSTKVQAIILRLAVLAFILTVVTHWTLIKFSAQLSNQISIPTKFLRENMSRALQQLRQAPRRMIRMVSGKNEGGLGGYQ